MRVCLGEGALETQEGDLPPQGNLGRALYPKLPPSLTALQASLGHSQGRLMQNIPPPVLRSSHFWGGVPIAVEGETPVSSCVPEWSVPCHEAHLLPSRLSGPFNSYPTGRPANQNSFPSSVEVQQSHGRGTFAQLLSGFTSPEPLLFVHRRRPGPSLPTSLFSTTIL